MCIVLREQHSCIYVKRAGKFEEDKARRQLDLVTLNDTSVSIVCSDFICLYYNILIINN